MVILSQERSGIVLKLWHVNAISVDVMRLNILSSGLDPYDGSRVLTMVRILYGVLIFIPHPQARGEKERMAVVLADNASLCVIFLIS